MLNQKLLLERPHLKLPYSLFCKTEPCGLLPQTSTTGRHVSANCMTMPKWKQTCSSTSVLLTHRVWAKPQRSCAVTLMLKLACTGNVSHERTFLTHTASTGTSGTEITWWYQWLRNKAGQRETITVVWMFLDEQLCLQKKNLSQNIFVCNIPNKGMLWVEIK